MDASKSPIINLQNYCCKAPQDDPTPWMEIEDVILYDAQRHILSSDMEWLDDKIILAAELLFKRKYPHISGLQSPSLAETMSFEPQPSSPILQILCQNNNHWILVSTVGCPPKTVRTYDSMNGHLSSKNKKVVADILRCKSDAIVLEYIQVQYQIGTSDCGLFSIAFAASICNSEDPGKVLFHQNSLRSHLKVCLENGEITQFPRKGTRRANMEKVVQTKLSVFFCICRLPNDGKPMIKCKKCREWYHAQCIGLNPINLEKFRSTDWYCPNCDV